MNNREKYKDELIETIKKDGEICEFMKWFVCVTWKAKNGYCDISKESTPATR